MQENVVVVGGGLVGAMMAALLTEKNKVSVYESRPDLRKQVVDGGRSINLIMTSRGLKALRAIGLQEKAKEIGVPVHGRTMHSIKGELTYQPYGIDDSEFNYSISRKELNKVLMTRAEELGAQFYFRHRLLAVDEKQRSIAFEKADGAKVSKSVGRLIGADGGGSQVRAWMTQEPGYDYRYEPFTHAYKELKIPAEKSLEFNLDPTSLHIWPRGGIMLMALPNRDGSFTVTLYLPIEGVDSFATLQTDENVSELFTRLFPDSVPLIPDLHKDFAENPVSSLGTVRCNPWHVGGFSTLIGDAAHAIVPFFGQGMNCGLEDCTTLVECIEDCDDWQQSFELFSKRRKPNADAIADLSLDNFVEMAERVGDPRFLLKKKVEQLLENKWPTQYRSRYALVVYTLVPYYKALAAGHIQNEILDDLCKDIDSPEDVDLDKAKTLIDARLTPYLGMID